MELETLVYCVCVGYRTNASGAASLTLLFSRCSSRFCSLMFVSSRVVLGSCVVRLIFRRKNNSTLFGSFGRFILRSTFTASVAAMGKLAL
jgi:hypothetical protein